MSGHPNIIASDRQTAPARRMVAALVGLGVCCSLLIATVFVSTKPLIEARRSARLAAAVLAVLPGAVSSRTCPFDDGRGSIHAAYDASGTFIGYAIEASGMGYQDEITLLYGYRPDTERVVGMTILASRETPGLGDRIATYPSFIASFEALDVRLDSSGTGLLNRVVSVKAGERNKPWQIDGITGATVSSEAVATIVDGSAAWWLPRIHAEPDCDGSVLP